jgi:hypothetical protein
MELPRLVSGNCQNCSSTEIVVKRIAPDGRNYEGYCPSCGIDSFGALIFANQAGTDGGKREELEPIGLRTVANS